MFDIPLSAKKVQVLAADLDIEITEAADLVGAIALKQFLDRFDDPYTLKVMVVPGPRPADAVAGHDEEEAPGLSPWGPQTGLAKKAAEEKAAAAAKATEKRPRAPRGGSKAKPAPAAPATIVYDGPPLSQQIRADLVKHGFTWNTDAIGTADETTVSTEFTTWLNTKGDLQADAEKALAMVGWVRAPKAA